MLLERRHSCNQGTTLRAISQAIRPFGLESQCRLCDGLGCPVCGEYRKPRKNKFNAVKTVVDGITFDSKREAARYGELKLLEKGGFIRNLELQPQFEFKLNSDGKVLFRYRADFRYFEGATRICEDVKGLETAVFKLKRKLIEAAFNVKITIVK